MSGQQVKKQIMAKPKSLADSAGRLEHPFLWAVVLFAASFVLHTILNILVKENVIVTIDEALYTNIARSLAWKGKVAFRGQPVSYPYLLYPLLLVPVYRLNALLGGDIYRVIQVLNTLLITSSVFPVFCFARDFSKNDRKALLAALAVTLMPDMVMGGYEMTECLIWPLSLWMVFFCYRFYCSGRLTYGLWTAVFTGLLFAAKPGAVAAGAVMLVVYFIKSVLRNRENIRNSLLSLLLLLFSIGVVYGIFILLYGVPDSFLGLYAKQTGEWKPADILVALEAVFMLAFLFIFACGGIFGLFPVLALGEYDKEKRRFILSFLLGVLMVIIGTSVFVVPYKWSGKLGELPLHLRYCSMFIPVMFVLSTDRNLESRKYGRLTIALGILAALSVFPGARAGFVNKFSGIIDSLSLAAFIRTSHLNGNSTGWIITVLAVICYILLICQIAEISKQNIKKADKSSQRQQKLLFRIGTAWFLMFLVYNSVCAHVCTNVDFDPTVSADALEVNQKIIGQECLGITQRKYDDIHSYWLESRLNIPMQQVTVDQMFATMEENDGVYSPFVPLDQAPNVNNHETPDTNTFVLGMSIADHLELSDTVTAEKTKNGHFSIVRINPSRRWVDTMMYGLDYNVLYTDTPAYIAVFDENRNQSGSVTVTFRAYGSGTLNVDGNKIEMDRQEKDYEVTVPYSRIIPISAENDTVQILSYSTRKN